MNCLDGRLPEKSIFHPALSKPQFTSVTADTEGVNRCNNDEQGDEGAECRQAHLSARCAPFSSLSHRLRCCLLDSNLLSAVPTAMPLYQRYVPLPWSPSRSLLSCWLALSARLAKETSWSLDGSPCVRAWSLDSMNLFERAAAPQSLARLWRLTAAAELNTLARSNSVFQRSKSYCKERPLGFRHVTPLATRPFALLRRR